MCNEEILTVLWVAYYLKASTKMIPRLIKCKQILASKVGRYSSVMQVDIDGYLKRKSKVMEA